VLLDFGNNGKFVSVSFLINHYLASK